MKKRPAQDTEVTVGSPGPRMMLGALGGDKGQKMSTRPHLGGQLLLAPCSMFGLALYKCTYVYIYIYVCIFVYYLYMYIIICIYIYIYLNIKFYACICTYRYKYVYVYRYIMLSRYYIHIYIYIHTHCIFELSWVMLMESAQACPVRLLRSLQQT